LALPGSPGIDALPAQADTRGSSGYRLSPGKRKRLIRDNLKQDTDPVAGTRFISMAM
jgi:hypothetical protein